MGKLKNYLLATAGLVILGGAFHFVMPLQAVPPPFPPETMVITLAEDLTTAAITEFDAVDVSGFRFVSFLAKGNFVGEQLQFRFLSESER